MCSIGDSLGISIRCSLSSRSTVLVWKQHACCGATIDHHAEVIKTYSCDTLHTFFYGPPKPLVCGCNKQVPQSLRPGSTSLRDYVQSPWSLIAHPSSPTGTERNHGVPKCPSGKHGYAGAYTLDSDTFDSCDTAFSTLRPFVPHAIQESACLCCCRSSVTGHIGMHCHHISYPEVRPVAAFVRVSDTGWQPEPGPARSSYLCYSAQEQRPIWDCGIRRCYRRPGAGEQMGPTRQEGQEHAGQSVDIGLWKATAGVDRC